MPIKVFEISEVVFKDISRERQARNERHAAAVWCNKSAGFEIVHGMLDRAMKMLEVPYITNEDSKGDTGYYIKETTGKLTLKTVIHNCGFISALLDPMFFPGRAANIFYRPPSTQRSANICDLKLGSLGILHPTVLEKFEIGFPCSSLEFTLKPFKKAMHKDWTNHD